MAPSRHDWKIVDWDVKPQHNQPTLSSAFSELRIATSKIKELSISGRENLTKEKENATFSFIRDSWKLTLWKYDFLPNNPRMYDHCSCLWKK